MNKTNARKVLKAIEAINKQVAELNKLTDSVVEKYAKNGTDDMQSDFWQNVQYMADIIRSNMDSTYNVEYDCKDIISGTYN